MIDELLRSKLVEYSQKTVESTEDIMIDTQVPEKEEETNKPSGNVEATAVMTAYQNANKWLDIIKESLLMDYGCVFFSNYVHNLAHTMPVRFDAFGDILHTVDMKVPYPATEYIDSEPADISQAFDKIFSILDSICEALSDFAENAPCRAVTAATEDLLIDISKEYTALKRMRRAYDTAGDLIKFDKWVAQYVNNQSNLLE